MSPMARTLLMIILAVLAIYIVVAAVPISNKLIKVWP